MKTATATALHHFSLKCCAWLLAAVVLAACAQTQAQHDAELKQIANNAEVRLADDPAQDLKFASLRSPDQQQVYNDICDDKFARGRCTNDGCSMDYCISSIVDETVRACVHASSEVASDVYASLTDNCYGEFKLFLKAADSLSTTSVSPLAETPGAPLTRARAQLAAMARIPGASSTLARAQVELATWLSRQREAAAQAKRERAANVKAAIRRLRKRYPGLRGMTRTQFVASIISGEVNALGEPIFSDGRIGENVLTLYTPVAEVANGIATNSAPYDQINDTFVAWCDCDGRTDIVLKTFGYKMGLAQIGLDRDGSSAASLGAFRPDQGE